MQYAAHANTVYNSVIATTVVAEMRLPGRLLLPGTCRMKAIDNGRDGLTYNGQSK